MSKIDSYEQRFHQIVNNILDIIVEIDLKGKFTFVSPQVYDILGYYPDEVIGVSVFKFVHPEDLPKVIEKMRDSLKPKKGNSVKKYTIEYRALHKKGHYIFLSARGSLVEFEGNMKIIAVLSDITERKLTEQKLKESEEKYRLINENANDLIVLIGSNFQNIFVNNAYLSLGYSMDEIPKLRPVEFIHPNDFDQAIKVFKECLKTGTGLAEIRFKYKDGHFSWFEVKGKSFRDENGDLRILLISRDITERKKAEQKVKESEERYRSLFENSPSVILLINMKGDILDCNLSTERISGFKKNELIGKNILNFSFIPQVSVPKVVEDFKLLRKGGLPEPQEIQLYRKDKSIAWAYYQISSIRLNNEDLIELIIQDITSIKIAEQELRESEEKYSQLIEDSLEGVWAIDENAYTTLVNPSISRILGYSIEEMIGKNLFEFVPQKDIEMTKINLEKRRKGIKEEFEKEFIRKDGKKVYTRLISSPNFDNNGNYIGSIAFVSDITKKKEAEQKMKESEEKFKTIAEQSFVGFIIIQNNRIVYSNAPIAKIFGYSFEELNQMSISDAFTFVHPEDLTIAANRFKKREEGAFGEISSEPFRIKTSSGEIKWVDVYTKMFKFQEKDTIFATIVDVTKEREADIELQKLNELKSEFLRRASHELKTPLISIKGFTNLVLKQYGGTLDNEIISMLEEVDRGCHRLEDIIKNLIEATKIESSKLELKTTVEDLSFLIRFCTNELRGLAKSRNHVINVNIDKKIITKFNKEQMYEVLTNLLSNAIKYTPPHGEITIKSEIKDQNIIVSIQDNGIGFTDKEKEKVFKQFGKIERYGQGLDIGIDGSGLGLYLSKEIVELHGGKIWMESEGKNKGSIFYVLLPLIKN